MVDEKKYTVLDKSIDWRDDWRVICPNGQILNKLYMMSEEIAEDMAYLLNMAKRERAVLTKDKQTQEELERSGKETIAGVD